MQKEENNGLNNFFIERKIADIAICKLEEGHDNSNMHSIT